MNTPKRARRLLGSSEVCMKLQEVGRTILKLAAYASVIMGFVAWVIGDKDASLRFDITAILMFVMAREI